MQLSHTYHNGTLLYNTSFTKQAFQNNFLSVINTNSLSILHRFQVMADYLSNFRKRQESVSL